MTAIEDRITEVLRQHRPYEAIDGNLYCKNHDCRPATAEEVEAWDWAAHVAAAVVAELQLTQQWTVDMDLGPERIRCEPTPFPPRGELCEGDVVVSRWVTGWEKSE